MAIRRTPSFLLLGLMLSQAASGQQSEQQLLDDVDSYRAQIEDLEQQVGRYDMQLLEPLSGLAEALTELEQFEERRAVLDQTIQIVRMNDGLYTGLQFPYLILEVRNNARRGNWADANETLDYLAWLYVNKHPGVDGELINEFLQLSDLHMEGVAGDLEERQSYHFRVAEQLTWAAIRVGEAVWPAADQRLVALYHRLLIQYHLQSMAVLRGGETSQDLRQVVPGGGWMLAREEVMRKYYSMGTDVLARMRRVYAAADPPDLEALAMVDLYQADWQVMFDEGDAATTYLRAYSGLLDAGVEVTALESYFNRPRILPVDRFYASIALASEAAASQSRTDANELEFAEWSSAFPNVQLAFDQPTLLQEEIDSRELARLVIKLEGTEKIARWIQSRYVTQVSVPAEIELLEQTPGQALSIEDLRDRLHYLNFRPVLEDGIPRPFEGILRYQYF